MRWWRTFFCLLAVLMPAALRGFDAAPLPLAAQPAESTLARWREAGLPFRLAEGRLTAKLCSRSERDFLGCVAGLSALVGLWDEPTALIPAGAGPDVAGRFGSPRFSFGPVQAVSLRAAGPVTPAELYRLDRELRRTVRAAWAELYRSGGAARIDFASAVAWAKRRFVNAGNESAVTALVLNALLGDADPYARLEPRRQLGERARSAGTEVVGIGVLVQAYRGRLIVVHVLPGGPADKAGLRINDLLYAIDGAALYGDRPGELSRPLLGAPGSRVTVTVDRDERLFDVEVTRAPVELPHVLATLYAHRGRLLGYLRLDSFTGKDIGESVDTAVRSLEAAGAGALVLDLRGNDGGNAEVIGRVANVFLPEGRLVFTERFLASDTAPRAVTTRLPATTALPLAVVVDGNTGSAAEVLAGALQDHGRASLVGERTHGKGTLQEGRDLSTTRPFRGLGVVLYETVARLLRPSGVSPQLIGVLPDFGAAPDPAERAGGHFYLRAEDRYPNALPADGAAYVPGDADRRRRVEACVERTSPRRLFESRQAEGMPLDYQLLVAADVLHCQLP